MSDRHLAREIDALLSISRGDPPGRPSLLPVAIHLWLMLAVVGLSALYYV